MSTIMSTRNEPTRIERETAARAVRLVVMVAAIVSVSGAAWAQQAQGERTGVGEQPATSAQPDLGPSTRGRSGTDDCNQGNQVGSDCSPSSVGSDTRSLPGPVGDTTGAPMSGSGSTGSGATEGGDNRTPSGPSGGDAR